MKKPFIAGAAVVLFPHQFFQRLDLMAAITPSISKQKVQACPCFFLNFPRSVSDALFSFCIALREDPFCDKKNSSSYKINIPLFCTKYYPIFFSGYPVHSSYQFFLDSGSRSLRSFARNDGLKNIR